jgi:uncharacterized protein YktB (UPF0637 family)
MLRYYTWALGEKVLGTLPGGSEFYGHVGRRRKRDTQPPGATIMEVGTDESRRAVASLPHLDERFAAPPTI